MRRSLGSTLRTDVADLADCDLVIEAIVEEIEPKRELFAELDRITRPDAVLATNTSALSVSDIAEATEHPDRVVGMHFFNPAPCCRSSKSFARAVRATRPCGRPMSGPSRRASGR